MTHRLSCSKACGIVPDQGSNLCLLPWQVDFFFFFIPLSHQGCPLYFASFNFETKCEKRDTQPSIPPVKCGKEQGLKSWYPALDRRTEIKPLDISRGEQVGQASRAAAGMATGTGKPWGPQGVMLVAQIDIVCKIQKKRSF